VTPAAFDYVRARSVDEALSLLAQSGGSAKLLAGGQSLLPLLKLRVAQADRLIDIGRIAELRGVRDWNGGLSIGALTTYRGVLDSPLVAQRFPVLIETIVDVADVQVRNRGTIGGGIAHADPASDVPAVAIALDAQVVLRSAKGERTVPADQFFLGSFTTALRDDEILTEIRIPALPKPSGAAYLRLEQPASGYSIAGVAVVLTPPHGARIGVTGVGEVAYRARAVEDALAAGDRSAGAVSAAVAHIADGQRVASDIHADREYRAHVAQVLARRAIDLAMARAQGR